MLIVKSRVILGQRPAQYFSFCYLVTWVLSTLSISVLNCVRNCCLMLMLSGGIWIGMLRNLIGL